MRRGDTGTQRRGDESLDVPHEISASPRRSVSASQIDWPNVRRVLAVKLRSIGDTVLATPSLHALRRFLPHAQIDILLEDWVAPLLEGHEDVDHVISVGRGTLDRIKTAAKLAAAGYDVAFNLHGGTTATFFTAASRAKHRIGFANYQYSFLYNHLLSSASDFWGREKTHSAEQQLALLGSAGVPVDDRPKSRLFVTAEGGTGRVSEWRDRGRYALLHPGTAFHTKQWAPENYAATAEFLARQGLKIVAIGTPGESSILEAVRERSSVPIETFTDLSLPEIIALARESRVFVGNDSGIAHIAAAVGTPTIVVFGSSNRAHWSPWTDAPNEMVFQPFDCQPCAGYKCEVFGEPRCILAVTPAAVIAAAARVLSEPAPSAV